MFKVWFFYECGYGMDGVGVGFNFDVVVFCVGFVGCYIKGDDFVVFCGVLCLVYVV